MSRTLYIYIFLASFAPFFFLHYVNLRFDTSEKCLVYGDLQNVEWIEKLKSKKAHWRARFLVDQIGYYGSISKTIPNNLQQEIEVGQKVQIELTLRDGFLGWKWIKEAHIVKVDR